MNAVFNIVDYPEALSTLSKLPTLIAIDPVSQTITCDVPASQKWVDMTINIILCTFGPVLTCNVVFANNRYDYNLINYIKSKVLSTNSSLPIHSNSLPTDCGAAPAVNYGNMRFPPSARVYNHMQVESELLSSNLPNTTNKPQIYRSVNDTSNKYADNIVQELIRRKQSMQGVPNLHPVNIQSKDKLYNYIRCSIGCNITQHTLDYIVQKLRNTDI